MPLSVFCHVGNHGDNNNSIKALFCANKEGSKSDGGFWKIISDNCGFHGNEIIESAKLFNLVTMAKNNIV